MKFFLKLLRLRLSMDAHLVSKVRTAGIYDWIEEGKHVLFLDYDIMRYEWMLQELKYLQKKYNLSEFYIFESSKNSYHAICCDELTAIECQEIVLDSNCDESFKNAMFYDYRSRVLRCFPKGETKKPRYLATMKTNRKPERFKSLGHLLYIKKHFGAPINTEYHNNKSRVWFVDYPTKKNI